MFAILTPVALDALGLGALLALLWQSARSPVELDRIVRWIGVAGLGLLAVEEAVERSHSTVPGWASVTSLAWPLLFVWLVHHVSRGVGGPVGHILRFRPLAFVGVVSYGIYLFHLFVMPTALIIERHTRLDLPVPSTRGIVQFVVVTVVSVVAASLSWGLLERPINERKRHFPYVPTAANEPKLESVRSAAVPPGARC